MQQMSLEHTQITSWGLSVPFCIFFFSSCAKCSTWYRRRSEQLADGDDQDVYISQAHRKMNIPKTLSGTFAFLKVSVTSVFA